LEGALLRQINVLVIEMLPDLHGRSRPSQRRARLSSSPAISCTSITILRRSSALLIRMNAPISLKPFAANAALRPPAFKLQTPASEMTRAARFARSAGGGQVRTKDKV
jgi:hypothetical protein